MDESVQKEPGRLAREPPPPRLRAGRRLSPLRVARGAAVLLERGEGGTSR